MKKLLLALGLTFLAFGTTAFAQVSSEALAEVIHTAEDTMHKELLEGEIDYGISMSETDLLCNDIDFSKMYRRYPLLYNETYIERLSTPGLLGLLYDEPMESFFGYGVGGNKLYRLHLVDLGQAVDEETVAKNPEENGKYSQCYPVSGEHNYNLADYAEALAEVGANEVYDAYLATFYVYTRGKNYCYIAYFDTDKGEFVMNIAKDREEISVHSDEKLEYLVPYTMDEFFDKMDIVLNNVTEYNASKSGTYIDENGDESTKTLEIGVSYKNNYLEKNLAEVIHTAEDTAYPEALKGEFDYGKNHSETDLICDDFDFSKMYRRYTIIYPTEEFYDYYFIPENKGLFQFIRDESMDSEIYVGKGKDEKMYYIRINDPWYDIEENDVKENPELYAGTFKYGEKPYSICHETTSTYNFSLDEYAEILSEADVDEVYDAYFAAFHIGSQTSQHKYYVMYFDTDKGEYILNIDSENVSAGQKSDEELEYMRLYSLSELYDNAKMVLRDMKSNRDSSKSGTYIDENGDDITTKAKNETDDSDKAELAQTEQEDKEEKEDSEQLEKEEKAEQPEKTDIDVILYGKKLVFPDQKPIVDSNRVLVPLRVIFEALDAEVLWDGETQTVTATKGDITISLTLGEKKIIKNGEVIEIDVPAQAQNQRTLVPIRVVSESFENTVSWDGTNRIVEIK